MKSSKRIQRVAQKIAGESDSNGPVLVTYVSNGRSDTWDVLGKTDYEYDDHLEDVFGDDWDEGQITKVEGLPYFPSNGPGLDTTDLFYMVDFLNEYGYYALEAALKTGFVPNELSHIFQGEYGSLEELGRSMIESKGGHALEDLDEYIDYTRYARDHGNYVKGSNGKLYVFEYVFE